jgi:DNA-binding LytR/AlgR family response regulator
VFWKEVETIKSQMIRTSLLNAEDILKEYKFILKCHRSYLININHIDKIEGNSQGYKLFLDNVSFAIPVSRNSIDKLQGLI